jgi:hypothetical protein
MFFVGQTSMLFLLNRIFFSSPANPAFHLYITWSSLVYYIFSQSLNTHSHTHTHTHTEREREREREREGDREREWAAQQGLWTGEGGRLIPRSMGESELQCLSTVIDALFHLSYYFEYIVLLCDDAYTPAAIN